ncbi:MAG: glutaminyl-peptide cyclotransferase [Cyclobacteriaceae bacterium]|jgi:glutamine cyclotransferase
MQKYLIALCAFGILLSCQSKKKEAPSDLIGYNIVKVFPHDKDAFTQGLVVEQGKLFEGTGQYGTSWIAEVDIASGKQDKKVQLSKEFFGEGITILNNKVYQLTYQNKQGFVYDLRTFEKIKDFSYSHEGWGITHNGKNLFVSDGTNKIHVLDTLTLQEVSTVTVTDGDKAAERLNELEFIDGFLYANQWQTNFILKIDLASGKVVGRMDMTKLAEEVFPLNPNADVLNGIAYEKKSKLLLITGKLWPAMVAVKIQPSVAE